MILQFNVIRTDILVMSVLHSESAGNCPKLFEAKAFVKMSCVYVGFHDSIELQNSETQSPPLFQTIKDKLLTYMLSSNSGWDCIACVADMAASADIIGMQDI